MIGNSIARLARGEQLTLAEIEELRYELNAMQAVKNTVSSWIGADGSLSVPFLRAEQAEFQIMPLGLLYLGLQGAQSIPNDVATPVSFEVSRATSPYFNWESATPTRITWATPKCRPVLFLGMAEFAANSTGRRAVHINQYDASDTLLSGATLISIQPDTSLIATIPFASPFLMEALTSYIKATVQQTSGGALDLGFFRLGILIGK